MGLLQRIERAVSLDTKLIKGPCLKVQKRVTTVYMNSPEMNIVKDTERDC